MPSSEHARRALQPLEKHRHRAHVEAGRRKQTEPEAVGLALEVARVVDLRLHRPGLRRHHRALREVRPRTRREHRQHHRGHGRDRELLLRADQARDMALGDVRDLVREHRREFRLRLRGEQQPGIHADEAAGQRERVDRADPGWRKIRNRAARRGWLRPAAGRAD